MCSSSLSSSTCEPLLNACFFFVFIKRHFSNARLMLAMQWKVIDLRSASIGTAFPRMFSFFPNVPSSGAWARTTTAGLVM